MNKKHECNWDSVEWETQTSFDFPVYRIGGLGETLERKGKCEVCGKTFREVYVHSCIIDNDTGEITTL